MPFIYPDAGEITRNMKPINVGILTESKPTFVDGRPMWHEGVYTHLAHTRNPNFINIYVVDPSSLPSANYIRDGQTFGWQLTGRQKSPVYEEIPPIDIVYNRITTRAYEGKARIQSMIDGMSRTVPLFNSRFLNKDEIHRALKTAEPSQWWPTTYIGEGRNNISDLLTDFDVAYVKPATGSFGRGIMKLTRAGQGWTYVRLTQPNSHPRVGTLTEASLDRMVRRLYRHERFLVQKAIESARVGDRPFDLRVLMQRDVTLSWKMTGVGGRVALKNAPTAHTVHGGTVISFDELTTHVRGIPDEQTLESICKTSIETFERVHGISLYEASVDIVVTPDGRPFVLEINSKPYPFDEPHIKKHAASVFFSLIERLCDAKDH